MANYDQLPDINNIPENIGNSSRFKSANYQMACAVWNGDISLVNDLINNGDITFKQSDETHTGFSFLGVACAKGHIDIVMLFLAWKESLVSCDHLSPWHGYLLKQCSIEFQDENQDTLLMSAVQTGNADITERLLQHGAQDDNQEIYETTSIVHDQNTNLHNASCLALESGVPDMKHSLKRESPEQNNVINFQNRTGHTALMIASRHGHAKIVEQLLQYDALVDMKNLEGNTALITAARYGHDTVAELLIQHNANVYVTNNYGATALISAAHEGHHKCVELLLQYNELVAQKVANVDQMTIARYTALMFASKYGHNKVVDILLQHHANVDMRDNDGVSALILASKNGHYKVVEMLLLHNANVNIQEKDGFTALMFAAQNSHEKVVELLLQHTHSHQPKMRIIDIRDRRLVRFLNSVFCTGCKNGVLGEIMFVTNIVYVAMITFDILVDISIPNIRQNGLADAYFVVVISRWIKRNFAIYFCASNEIHRAWKRTSADPIMLFCIL